MEIQLKYPNSNVWCSVLKVAKDPEGMQQLGLLPHVPYDGERRQKEYDLHDGVVQGYEGVEEVEVPRDEHDGVQLLCLKADSCAAFGCLDLQ